MYTVAMHSIKCANILLRLLENRYPLWHSQNMLNKMSKMNKRKIGCDWKWSAEEQTDVDQMKKKNGITWFKTKQIIRNICSFCCRWIKTCSNLANISVYKLIRYDICTGCSLLKWSRMIFIRPTFVGDSKFVVVFIFGMFI